MTQRDERPTQGTHTQGTHTERTQQGTHTGDPHRGPTWVNLNPFTDGLFTDVFIIIRCSKIRLELLRKRSSSTSIFEQRIFIYKAGDGTRTAWPLQDIVLLRGFIAQQYSLQTQTPRYSIYCAIYCTILPHISPPRPVLRYF